MLIDKVWEKIYFFFSKTLAFRSIGFTKEEIDFLSDFVDKHLKEMDNVDEEEDKIYGEKGMHQLPDDFNKSEKGRRFVREIVNEINPVGIFSACLS